MKKNRRAVWLVIVAALAVLVYAFRDRIHFDWVAFGHQLQLARWSFFGFAIMLIWISYGVRSVRWALFLKPIKRVPAFSLLGTQVIGFTAVALLGRPADPVRPYLVSKRTNLPLSQQFAVYAVERMFDMGSVALIFAVVLLFAPDRHTLPHPEIINRAALAALVVVIAFVIFAFFVRAAGKKIAEIVGGAVGSISPKLGAGVKEKILDFREGLNAISTLGDFLLALAMSLFMWMMIASSYLLIVRAFTASPELSSMTLSRCMLLMAASTAGSLIQLPIIGWFTQIGIVAKTLQGLFGAAYEPAVAAAAMLLIVMSMSIAPVGLIWSRLENLSLNKLTEESEEAAEHEGPDFAPEL